METSLKQRLVGAVVLIALAVIFLPMLVKGPAPDSGVSNVSLNVPAEPGTGQAEDADRISQDLPLVRPGTPSADGVSGMPSAQPETATPAQAAPADAGPLAAAGDYVVGFGNYASAGDADKVVAALRGAGLPGYREAVRLDGREVQRVRIGPFTDQALAESARLRAGRLNPTVDAKVVALDAQPAAPPAPAAPKPATPAAPAAIAQAAPKPEAKPEAKPVAAAEPTPVAKAEPPAAKPADTSNTGFVVQVGAFADANAATALRDKLRGAGLNAFTDAVNTDAGKRTRVRVGPAMTRAEADALKAQVKAKAGIDGIIRPHP